jgi:hypothetical protein
MSHFPSLPSLEFVFPDSTIHRIPWQGDTIDCYRPEIASRLQQNQSHQSDIITIFSAFNGSNPIPDDTEVHSFEHTRLVVRTTPDGRPWPDQVVKVRISFTSTEQTVNIKSDRPLSELRAKLPPELRTSSRFRFHGNFLDDSTDIWRIGIANDECLLLVPPKLRAKVKFSDLSMKMQGLLISQLPNTLNDFVDLLKTKWPAFPRPFTVRPDIPGGRSLFHDDRYNNDFQQCGSVLPNCDYEDERSCEKHSDTCASPEIHYTPPE